MSINLPRSARAVVVGSGAGGAPVAARLAQDWGDGVLLLEAGREFLPRDFTQIEREMIPQIYAAGGSQATADGAIGLLQGRALGGSTVINDAICFAPPPEIVERWEAYGVTLDATALAQRAATVDARLGVVQIPHDQIGRANYLLGLGAARLGWAGERLRHNSPGCIQCGFRHTGCAYGLKQSMQLTYVADARTHGAHIVCETSVHALSRRGKGWMVHTDRGDVQAEIVILAAGVLETPAILMRSGFEAGAGVQPHLQTVVWGDFADRVDGFNGIPMTYGVLEFADVYGHHGPGFVIEGVSLQPLAFSAQPPGDGELKSEILSRYRYLAGALMLLRPRGRGRVRLSADRPVVDFPWHVDDMARTKTFVSRAVELWLASGAKRALLPHRSRAWARAVEDVTDLEFSAHRYYAYSAHLFGGARRGDVCDSAGRVRGAAGLWVTDASSFPEALGVNPQVTIAALALITADEIAASG